MPRTWDAVIVGGGPAGSTAGRVLASAGCRVVIVDKSRFPRPKACGGLLTERAAAGIESLHGADLLGRVPAFKSSGCSLFHKGRIIAEAVDSPRTLRFVDRRLLDEALFSSAVGSGCQSIEGVKAVSLGDGEVTLEDGRVLKARVIVGADGVRGPSRRAAGRKAFGRGRVGRNVAFGLVAEYPVASLTDSPLIQSCRDRPHIHFGTMNWGYGWAFPKGETISLGVAGLKRKNGDFMGAFKGFRGLYTAGCSHHPPVRGLELPFGSYVRKPGRGRLLLVGDAAGLVEPVTGEGIDFAVESARLAASSIIDALGEDSPGRAAGLYNVSYARSLYRRLRQASIARLLLFPGPLLPLAARVIEVKKSLLPAYLDLLAGCGGYRELAHAFLSRGRSDP